MVEGILPLWKEKGMTSFDCVRIVRGILGIKKIGHAGTLDPEVEGVLPIAIGKATKVLEFMLEGDKTYSGEVTLGFSTSTEDATGEIVEKLEVIEKILEDNVDNILKEFVGTIEQTPPMFSAVKVDGKRLYEYAFEGKEIERPSRTVEIYAIERTSEVIADPKEKTARFSFDVTCSKGTYIRTLAVDIGKNLGFPAHMSKLTRIKSGRVEAKDTFTLDDVRSAMAANQIEKLLLPIDYGLESFPKASISKELWEKVKNGARLDETEVETDEFPVVLTYNDTIVALYKRHETKLGKIKPRKMFKTEL
jgi:tRNA pseudouridine55 synthase